MRFRRFAATALAALLPVLIAPASAVAVGKTLDSHEGLADFDARTTSVEPSALQRARVFALGARASWNRFGTPSSLIKDGDYLARGLAGSNAAEAARAWLADNSQLFRLDTVAGLELFADSRLAGDAGRAVTFRQRIGGLASAHGGLVTVGVTRGPGGWNVAYVSSSLTGATSLGGSASLTPEEAWAFAAANVGYARAVPGIVRAGRAAGWTELRVGGMHEAKARLVAFPTARGALPAYETLVVNASATRAYSHVIDAGTGAVLVRTNLVRHAAAPQAFNGTVPPEDAACGPRHGPYAVAAGTASVDVVANADLPANDIVLKLYRETTLVQAADTLFSPEAIHYEPTGGVPAGNYYVEVCDYGDGHGWDDPRTYRGTITINDTVAVTAYPPRWKVFPANPLPNVLPADPWDNPSTDIRKVWCWDANVNGNPVAGCDEEIGNLASRAPWDHVYATDSPSFTTVGNNAHSQEAWESPLTPDPTPYRPTSAQRQYVYPWANQWSASDCDYDAIATSRNDIDAATTNLFAMHNRMHDWSYHLGFTEENWNAQDYNHGLTPKGRQNDAVFGNAQAGALSGPPPLALGRDNANMITLPDGVHPITNMYLWQPIAAAFYPPCVDGDYDMAVIGHEYGHLIENRMIGKGGTRTGHHAGAMGESSGDLLGMEVLNEYGYVPVADENRYSVGSYATGEKQRGIRNYGMNASPLNFSDMGYDITGPQVHADGEIWSAANFDLRQALVAKYDGSYPASDLGLQRTCAEGRLPVDRCPGNRRWIQLVYDAYLLMPVDPSMVVARDAYLAADQMRFGGANQSEIWLAFARRGLGADAASSNTNADTDTDPTPDFRSPLHGSATITFSGPANTRVYVGHYEARVSPIADTNPTTTTPNLDETASFAAGTYDFVANAPGYGHVRFTQTFAAGEVRTVLVPLAPNVASEARGATATGDGVRHEDLIDDTEASNWESTGSAAPGKQVTVDLEGAAPVTVSRVQVSALLRPGQNRFTALRQFRIDACNASVADCSTADGFSSVYTSPPDAFPGDAPRPVAPHMILREFDIPDTEATHVRLVVAHNQCTGGAEFHGDQDRGDPLNDPDCVRGSARDNEVRVAELQVFGSGTAAPQPPAPQPPAPQPPAPQPPAPQPPAAQPPAPQPPVVIREPRGRCTIVGTAGPDRLVGTPRNDGICGLGGNDVILGRGGSDRVYGGAGNDVLHGNAGRDRLYGATGNDRVYGGPGHDLLEGESGRDRLYGQAGNDRILGRAGRDSLFGHAGSDRLGGGLDNDVLYGGAGRDILLGYSGNDRIYGGSGSNDLFGEAGNDVLFARNGSYDRVLGGRGTDRALLDLRDLVRFVERLARR